jgi:hypothetical protein
MYLGDRFLVPVQHRQNDDSSVLSFAVEEVGVAVPEED